MIPVFSYECRCFKGSPCLVRYEYKLLRDRHLRNGIYCKNNTPEKSKGSDYIRPSIQQSSTYSPLGSQRTM